MWLARSTKKAADAALDAAEVAQAQLKHARYPALLPIVTKDIPATGPAGDPERSRLSIPLKNVGTGPALGVLITLRSEAPIQHDPVHHPAVAVGASLVVELNTFAAAGAPPFDLEITYDDVAGDHYRVHASWNTDEHRYEDVGIDTCCRAAADAETVVLRCNQPGSAA